MAETVIEELAAQRLGKTLKGKWTLDEILGIGGMATVYGATHRNGAKVAIKILHSTLAGSRELSRRFVREAYLVNKVHHPGVVRVLDDDTDDDGAAFLVMDRAPGVSLCDRASERLLDEVEILEVAEQVLEVLAASHAAGVVHRDLKPDNLLVDEDGAIRLLDFGIARLLDDDSEWKTRSGITFGTPGYMAPEQALGKKDEISPLTDVYALGATMFMLMTGEYVQLADGPQELLVMIATRPARSIADVLPDVSPDVAALIDKATAFHPEQRWSSADVMLSEVRKLKVRRGIIEISRKSRRKLSSRMSAVEVAAPHGPQPVETKSAPPDPTRPSIHRLDRVSRSRGRRRAAVMIVAALCAAFGLIKVQRHADVSAQPMAEATAAETPKPTTLAAADPISTKSSMDVATPATTIEPTSALPASPTSTNAPKKTHPRSVASKNAEQGFEHATLVR